MTYQEVCASIERRGYFSKQAASEHAEKCLERMGHPDKKPGLVIHVAGTNGKGSVCSFLASVLREAGVRTGLFTSPHLVRINERISIDGEPISDEDFARVYEETSRAAGRLEDGDGGDIAYFEILFLMAMQYFSEREVGAAVIETGLGGTLDATNALASPTVTVITSIGLDHTGILGETVEEIAAEKAGIAKAGVPCVYSASDPKAAEVIRVRAEAAGASAYPLDPEDFRITALARGEIAFSTSFRYDGRADFSIRAAAPYQASNAALAAFVFYILRETGRFPEGIKVSGQQLADGLARMVWAARMEEIRPRVYLDGAHNPQGIAGFLEAARQISGGAACHLLFGVMKDKDYSSMIHLLAGGIPWKSVTVTAPEEARVLVSEEAAALFRREGLSDVKAEPVVGTALGEVLDRQGDGEYVMICGSLYLAGEIRRRNALK